MIVLSQSLPADDLQVKFKEPYVSKGLNRKSEGIIPTGVYRGYTPAVVALQLSLLADVDTGDSVAVAESLNASLVGNFYNTTVRHVGDIILDLTGVPNGTYFVVLEARYDLTSTTPLTGLTEVRIKLVNGGDLLEQHVILTQVTRAGILLTLDNSVRETTGGLVTHNTFSNRLKVAVGTNPSYPSHDGGNYQLAIVHDFDLNPLSIVPIDSKNIGFLTDKGFMLCSVYVTQWHDAQHFSNTAGVYVLPVASWGDPANQIMVQATQAGKGGVAYVAVIQLFLDTTAVSNSFIPGPFLSASPDPMSYPDTLVGNTVDQVITVSNLGDTSFTVTSVTAPAAPFSIISPTIVGTVLAPLGTATITVRFAPLAVGDFTSTIPIMNDAAQTVIVDLEGTGI